MGSRLLSVSGTNKNLVAFLQIFVHCNTLVVVGYYSVMGGDKVVIFLNQNLAA